jgi:hypothetical protein
MLIISCLFTLLSELPFSYGLMVAWSGSNIRAVRRESTVPPAGRTVGRAGPDAPCVEVK